MRVAMARCSASVGCERMTASWRRAARLRRTCCRRTGCRCRWSPPG
jgi:hypothetical protein